MNTLQRTALHIRQAALRLQYDVVLPPHELIPLPAAMSGVVSNWGHTYLEIDPYYIQANAMQPVAVMVLDTVDETEHPGLTKVVVRKWSANFTDSPSGAVQHHGTHVAGIIGAAPAPGPEGGPIGIARSLYDAGKLSIGLVKVLNDSGAGSYSWIAQGIDHVRDIAKKTPERFIINMSLGGRNPNAELKAAIDRAEADGILVICAAGNSGNRVDYPGAYPNTWAVGAIDMEGRPADFSGRGPEVTVAAPGVQITSTYGDNGYAALNGTSMASPHAAGMCAILLSLYPDLDPEEVRDYVIQYIIDLEAPGHDHATGYGVPKFWKYKANPYSETPPPPPPPEDEQPGGCISRVLPFINRTFLFALLFLLISACASTKQTETMPSQEWFYVVYDAHKNDTIHIDSLDMDSFWIKVDTCSIIKF